MLLLVQDLVPEINKSTKIKHKVMTALSSWIDVGIMSKKSKILRTYKIIIIVIIIIIIIIIIIMTNNNNDKNDNSNDKTIMIIIIACPS